VTIKKGSEKGKTVIGYHKLETIKNRTPWYSLKNELTPTHVLLIRFVQMRHFEVFLTSKSLADQTANLLYLKNAEKNDYLRLWCYLNSTIFYLTKEIFGMRMGGGVLQLYTDAFLNLPVPNLKKIEIHFEASRLFDRKPLPYNDEIRQPDRKELDMSLGFMDNELDKLVDELHRAFVEVVENRLIKAGRPLSREHMEEEVVSVDEDS